ncbi:MAG: glycerol-3-phosphate acyltransferase, partial [Candidatus Aminicenantales bacterium]
MVYIFLPLSYFIGSFSPAFYIVKWKINESVFNLGSGNAGAANVMNILGKKWGILVGLMDFSKGIAVVLLGQIMGLKMTSYVFFSGLVF